MDFSEEYIRMCKEATEIQRLWSLQAGDFFIRDSIKPCRDHVEVVCESDAQLGIELRTHSLIWLPRQDQLQAIIKTNSFWSFMPLDYLNREMANAYGPFYISEGFRSGEQFWLAVVMWLLYRKRWAYWDNGGWEETANLPEPTFK